MQREVFGMGLMKCALVEREVTQRLRQLGLAKREKRVKAVTGRTATALRTASGPTWTR